MSGWQGLCEERMGCSVTGQGSFWGENVLEVDGSGGCTAL